MVSELIGKIDDATAQRILGIVVRSRVHPTGENIAWDSTLAPSLASEFQLSPETTPVSEGELARQALLVLAEDPETRQKIEILAASPMKPEKFDFGATIALTTAVLIVLQTYVHFERTPDGKWNLKLEKKPTSDALLKGLIQKLLGYMK